MEHVSQIANRIVADLQRKNPELKAPNFVNGRWRHGSPFDRGRADAYYGRPIKPHYYVGGSYVSERIESDRMTPQEIADYVKGYDNCDDRKEW